MLRLLDRVNTIATSHAPVLLRGESGTGKELVARALHERGPRRDRPFVAVNCAAFPDTLLEAELFGHERGAFTGAVKRRDGRFRAAHGGTLLLDEIAEMSLPAQAKLLRVLQEGTIEPLGTNESLRVDVRVISATHRDLKERIADRPVPRGPLLPHQRAQRRHPAAARPQGRPAAPGAVLPEEVHPPGQGRRRAVSRRRGRRCRQFRFPGNVRELGHAIEHAVVLAGDGEIDLRHLPRDVIGTADDAAPIETCARAARDRAQGVRARLPAARAGAGGGQAHAGRRDPGHLPQEPVGEAAAYTASAATRAERLLAGTRGRARDSQAPCSALGSQAPCGSQD